MRVSDWSSDVCSSDLSPLPAAAPRISGKTAIISGAGQAPGRTVGNGRAMALLFAREGANLVLGDRDEAAAAETAELAEAAGAKTAVVTGDVTDPATAAAAVEAAVSGWGRADVLVNNVGINDGDGSITAVELDAWERIMRVNTRSVFLMSKAVIPVMRAQEGGAIVNIRSEEHTSELQSLMRISYAVFCLK